MTRPRRTPSFRFAAFALALFIAGLLQPWRTFVQAAQAPAPNAAIKYEAIDEAGMREWLTYLSSDQLQGRQAFTEGYGLATAYIADHLKAWGLKPIGDDGTYFQRVKLKGYRVTRNSSVTVVVKGEAKIFKQQDHVTFP